MTDLSAIDRRSLPPFVRRFLDTEAAGGVVLVVATIVAVAWASSPWRDSYATVWHTAVDLRVGTFGFTGDVHSLVNDGLMTVFFLVVGLEIKRELVTGDLRDPRVAALPAFAALGGMVIPAGIFLGVLAGGEGAHGWGIPMATDIAFAVGVLALLGPRVPPALKLFLLSLAIVDDVGAILVIAVVYSAGIDAAALAVATAFFVGALVLQRLRVHWLPVYAVLGAGCWLALHESGVHATIAGVAFGLLAPARPIAPAELARHWTRDLSDDPTSDELRDLALIANESISPAERVEHALHPLASFVIVPVFALANAGIDLRSPTFSRVSWAVALGLVAGKPLGIFGASWLAVRARFAVLPDGATWPAIAGIGALGGIGFTVSLFVTDLAFDDVARGEAARIAILAASVLSAAIGAAVLTRRRPAPAPPPAAR